MLRHGSLLRLVLAALVFAGGCGTAHEATRESGDLPPGRHVEIVDGELFLRCAGEGSPTVLLEAGAGLDSRDWRAVQPGVADMTTVCSYDRMGLGRSRGSLDALAEDTVVTQLHALLTTAGLRPPFVLVGHSMGGLYIRAYEQSYPGDVVGMVLVDSVTGAEAPLEDMPLVVLAAAHSSVGDQGDFSRLSRNSVLVVAEKSGHFIERDQPDLVVEAIRATVEAARTRSELAACGEKFSRLGGECVAR